MLDQSVNLCDLVVKGLGVRATNRRPYVLTVGFLAIMKSVWVWWAGHLHLGFRLFSLRAVLLTEFWPTGRAGTMPPEVRVSFTPR